MPSYGDVLLFAREEMSLDSVPGLNDRERRALSQYIASAPTRAEIDSLDAAGQDGLRDQRLAALTHYVLSLSRRRGAGFWLFRQQPEREPRRSGE
jgi:hypothetical protein